MIESRSPRSLETHEGSCPVIINASRLRMCVEGCQHCCFFIYFLKYFFVGSLIVVGLRGLLSHRMAPSCFDIDLSTAFDG